MHTALFVLGALAGAALADDMGKAVVYNNCDYTVDLCNVPASGAGFQEVQQQLQPGQSYEQTWTKIGDVQGGWSIKLTKIGVAKPVLQYEYTCKEDGIIWYDLSEVDGAPFGHDWNISANSGSDCYPKQTSYRYWNDDLNGMQSSCPQRAIITVTLCPNTGSGGSGASNSTSSVPSSSPAPAPSSQPAPAPAPSYAPAPAPSYAPAPAPSYAPASSSTSSPAPAAPVYTAPTYPQKQEVADHTTTSAGPANTHVVATTIVEVETVYATAYVTLGAEKRHVHHPHHNHHHHA